jgi:hypothetical protein
VSDSTSITQSSTSIRSDLVALSGERRGASLQSRTGHSLRKQVELFLADDVWNQSNDRRNCRGVKHSRDNPRSLSTNPAGITNGSDFSRYAKSPMHYLSGSIASVWIVGTLVSFIGLVTTSACQKIYGEIYWNRESKTSKMCFLELTLTRSF